MLYKQKLYQLFEDWTAKQLVRMYSLYKVIIMRDDNFLISFQTQVNHIYTDVKFISTRTITMSKSDFLSWDDGIDLDALLGDYTEDDAETSKKKAKDDRVQVSSAQYAARP